MLSDLKILKEHGKQYIPDLTKAEVAAPFKGLPVITNVEVDTNALVNICPTGAIGKNPVSLDMGKCVFCGECSFAFPRKVIFTNNHKIATNNREWLVRKEGDQDFANIDASLVRNEIKKIFGGSLKLRQVSAGGDNSTEQELNACGNVNFDIGRFGIEFVASPRHADGIVITGPISKNMAEALDICYHAVPNPKIVVLAGTDAISGGILADSPALDRSFLDKYPIDLYVPGNPPHPLTFINGILNLIRQ
ncbi:MAG: Ni,Fe-hydrogenase III small subunit [Cyclobacteriaceae bacterium]|jgi:Ni,Fe-hydrogenase III small subunit